MITEGFQLKRGQVGFATNYHSQAAAIIRWFTKSKWSHAFLVADVAEDRAYIMEAGMFCTDYRTITGYNNTAVATEIWEPIAPDPDGLALAKAMSFAMDATDHYYVGKEYGYLELFFFAVKIGLSRLFRYNIKHSPVHQGAICSQVAWAYCDFLYRFAFRDLDQYSVSPADLRARIVASGLFKLVASTEANTL